MGGKVESNAGPLLPRCQCFLQARTMSPQRWHVRGATLRGQLLGGGTILRAEQAGPCRLTKPDQPASWRQLAPPHPVESVRLLCRGEACILADGPGPPRVHAGIGPPAGVAGAGRGRQVGVWLGGLLCRGAGKESQQPATPPTECRGTPPGTQSRSLAALPHPARCTPASSGSPDKRNRKGRRTSDSASEQRCGCVPDRARLTCLHPPAQPAQHTGCSPPHVLVGGGKGLPGVAALGLLAGPLLPLLQVLLRGAAGRRGVAPHRPQALRSQPGQRPRDAHGALKPSSRWVPKVPLCSCVERGEF